MDDCIIPWAILILADTASFRDQLTNRLSTITSELTIVLLATTFGSCSAEALFHEAGQLAVALFLPELTSPSAMQKALVPGNSDLGHF